MELEVKDSKLQLSLVLLCCCWSGTVEWLIKLKSLFNFKVQEV